MLSLKTIRDPIEDATVIWSEVESGPVKVAQLRIPKQLMNDPVKENICENAVFSPWSTRVDFGPLGSLNRIRKPVYEPSDRERHRLDNGAETPFRQK